MPKDTVDRAIKRGAGGAEGGANYEEITYEGYGPGGTALMVRALTDNRNRTASDVRSVFTRGGGSLGEAGCVAWIFDAKGQITVPLDSHDPDEAQLVAIDVGADDVVQDEDTLFVYTEPSNLERVRRALEEKGMVVADAEQTLVPKTQVELDDHTAEQVIRLVDRLEELDDVQIVYSNSIIPDEVAEKLAG
jgi:YebC/PmpR family DNA-binding regulatory protein